MGRWTGEFGPDLPINAFRPRGGSRKGGMTLEGGGKRSKAPAPDPRLGQAALEQIALNREIFQDYRDVERPWMQNIANQVIDISKNNVQLAREQLDLARSQVERANALSDYQLDAMRRNDARYWSTVVPFEDELIRDARRFDSRAYKNQLVRQALADTQAQFSNALAQQRRGLARMGINPNSGHAAALANQTAIAQAAAMANAASKTRMAADQIGLSTKMQMYGGMRGLAGLGATNAGLATNAIGAGTGGVQAGLGAINTSQNAAAGMTGAAGSYLGANNSALGAMNYGVSTGIAGLGQYNWLQQNAAKVNNDASPLGAILGAGAQLGAALIAKSDRRLKDIIRVVGTHEPTGLTLYEFSFKGDSRRYIGVIADEVEKLYPEAVFDTPDGFKAVNYAALGLELVEVEGETV